MRYVMVTFLLAGGTAFMGPLWLLVKIAWKDRAVPSSHPDYAWMWGGKKIVYVAILFFVLVSAAFYFGAHQWYSMRG